MNISHDEAFDLLRNWLSDRTPVMALLTFPGSGIAVKVSGFISVVSDDVVVSDQPSGIKIPVRQHIILPVKLMESHECAEAKDLPIPDQYRATKTGPSNLRVDLTNGASISFFERSTSD